MPASSFSPAASFSRAAVVALLVAIVSHADPRPARPPATTLTALSWEDRIPLERAIAEGMARYRPFSDERGVHLLHASIDGGGAHLPGLTIGLTSVSRGTVRQAVDGNAATTVVGHEVRTARGAGITEWWRALPSGLEHGVTLDERPLGEGPLTLTMDAGDDVELALVDGAVAVSRRGRVLARYGQLFVFDADGARVPARLAVAEHIEIHVDDRDARYPLVVDPLIVTTEAELVAADGAAGDAFGAAVAISGDGTRVLVGADEHEAERGAAYVFVRTPTGWVQEAELVASDRAVADAFGYSVALSRDGTRALIGAVQDDDGANGAGSAYVFVRVGSTWTQQAKLTSSTPSVSARFGQSVALSRDGYQAVVGATIGDVAHVFGWDGDSWSERARLAPDPALEVGGTTQFGNAVAISNDGDVVLIGARYDDERGDNAGAAYVFTRGMTGVWSQVKITAGTSAVVGGELGWSLALAADGESALIGARGDDSAYVFRLSGGTWVRESRVTPPASVTGSFAQSLALSEGGTRALIGAPGVASSHAVVFARRAPGEWTFERAIAVSGGWRYGSSVALSTDGVTAAVGAPGGSSLNGRVDVLGVGRLGVACGDDSGCDSGFCVDGVCCDSACGASASDCQVCAAALGAAADGVCTIASPGIVCRASAGACDVEEVCNGVSGQCPSDARLPADVVCRGSAGACDVAESCDGVGATCPADQVAAADTVCRATGGLCDVDERCDGVASVCPDDILLGAETTCRASMGPCDVAEVCTGTTAACPDERYAPAGMVCAPSSGAVCDAPDLCTGTSADCMPTFLAGVECRASMGACDLAELCTGASDACPPDQVASAGSVCRASIEPRCDPLEACDGLAASCPADENDCAAADASLGDAGPALDAGAPPAPAEGCSCRAGSARTPRLVALGLALALAVARRRRR